jgi:hypothetical protein
MDSKNNAYDVAEDEKSKNRLGNSHEQNQTFRRMWEAVIIEEDGQSQYTSDGPQPAQTAEHWLFVLVYKE